jgi:hypothetical protein
MVRLVECLPLSTEKGFALYSGWALAFRRESLIALRPPPQVGDAPLTQAHAVLCDGRPAQLSRGNHRLEFGPLGVGQYRDRLSRLSLARPGFDRFAEYWIANGPEQLYGRSAGSLSVDFGGRVALGHPNGLSKVFHWDKLLQSCSATRPMINNRLMEASHGSLVS